MLLAVTNKRDTDRSTFEFEGNDIIGTRTYETGEITLVAEWVSFFMGLFFFIALMFISDWNLQISPLFYVGRVILFAILFLPFTVPLLRKMPHRISILRNKQCKAPTIAVRKDGVFILYHENGKKDQLEDKITDVTYSYSTIIFTLTTKSGDRYEKSVKYVANNYATLKRIKNILSYTDDNYTLTNYEKAKLFCHHCGTFVQFSEKQCPHCGNKNFVDP